MKGYGKNKESSYLQYWEANNLYGWAMSQKLPGNNFEWIKNTSQFNEIFIKNYNEESYAGHFLKVDVQYLGKLHELQNNLPLLPEFVIHIRNFKQALNHGLVLKKMFIE